MSTTAKEQRYVSLAVIGLMTLGLQGGWPGLDMVLRCEAISNDAHIPCKGLFELELTPIQPMYGEVPEKLQNNISRNYTTQLITTRWSAGPFFMTSGTSIPVTEAREIRSEQRSCDCRRACIFADWCVAFSTIKTPLNVSCHLADHLPVTTEANELAAYHVFYERLPDMIEVFTVKGTNDIYLVPMTPLTFPKAEAFCNSLPGFRIPVFITKTDIQILLSLYSELGIPLLVGLTKTLTGISWIDGTMYSDSYYSFYNPDGIFAGHVGENHFRFERSDSNLMFIDFTRNLYRVLCQAYLL